MIKLNITFIFSFLLFNKADNQIFKIQDYCNPSEQRQKKIKSICPIKPQYIKFHKQRQVILNYGDSTVHMYNNPGSFGKICDGVKKFKDLILKEVSYSDVESGNDVSREIEFMIRLQLDYDFVTTISKGCYTKRNLGYEEEEGSVGFLMQKLPKSLNFYIRKMKKKSNILLSTNEEQIENKKSYFENFSHTYRFLNIIKIQIMWKIALALYKLHNIGVGHFDIKDSNIFMENQFTPVIGDFGFTQSFLEAQQCSHRFWGTKLYLGKNVAKYKLEEYFTRDEQVDLFALGVLFHQILYGYNYEEFITENDIQEPRNDFENLLTPILKKLLSESLPLQRGSAKQLVINLILIQQKMLQNSKYLQTFKKYMENEWNSIQEDTKLNKIFKNEKELAYLQRLDFILNFDEQDNQSNKKLDYYVQLQRDYGPVENVIDFVFDFENDIKFEKKNKPFFKLDKAELFDQLENKIHKKETIKSPQNIISQKPSKNNLNYSRQEENSNQKMKSSIKSKEVSKINDNISSIEITLDNAINTKLIQQKIEKLQIMILKALQTRRETGQKLIDLRVNKEET